MGDVRGIAVAEDSGDTSDSGPKRYRDAPPVEKRRIQVATVARYRPHVARMVRKYVPRKHWEEGEQVGAIGVLVALEKYDHDRLTKVGGDRGAAFWFFAALSVREELQRWLDTAVYWKPRVHGKATAENSVTQMLLVDLDDLGPSDVCTESLVSEKELSDRLAAFLATLTDVERNLLLRQTRNRFCSESSPGYLSLVERARVFVKGQNETGCNSTSPPAPGTD